jgi:hypothetical protein
MSTPSNKLKGLQKELTAAASAMLRYQSQGDYEVAGKYKMRCDSLKERVTNLAVKEGYIV